MQKGTGSGVAQRPSDVTQRPSDAHETCAAQASKRVVRLGRKNSKQNQDARNESWEKERKPKREARPRATPRAMGHLYTG